MRSIREIIRTGRGRAIAGRAYARRYSSGRVSGICSCLISRVRCCSGLLTIVSLALATALLPASASAGRPYAFDDAGYLGAATLMPDWSATMTRQQEQHALLADCLAAKEACPGYYKGLRTLLLRAEDLTARQQIKLINHYVNRKRYRDDRTTHLETQYAEEPLKYRSRWATVEEFVRRGGDCEDYATTKYYLLRHLGMPTDRLRIVVTWDRSARGYHAILAVKHQDEVWLLESDNTIKRGRHHKYRFIYSINEESIWDHQAQASVVPSTQPSFQLFEDQPA